MEWTRMQQLNAAIEEQAPLSVPQLLEEEIREFTASAEYARMREAEEYYRNRSDVQRKANEVAKRSNTKIEHPILKHLVDQKADYLLSKPFTVHTGHAVYAKALEQVFHEGFRKTVKSLGKYAVIDGIAFLAPYFDEEGRLAFMRLPSTEVIPLWKNAQHDALDGYIRFYDQVCYEGKLRKVIRKVEYWQKSSVQYFQTRGNGTTRLFPDVDRGGGETPHFQVGDRPYCWKNIPLCWLKYNEEELPLCYFVKELIDDINWQTSVSADVLRDICKFIYILKGYGGADLGEFLHDLNKYLAVKVDGDGGIDKLQTELHLDAVMAFLEKNRRDIYTYANGVDVQNTDLGNASGVAIQFRYMGLDTDCTSLGTELKDTFRQMKPFIDSYLQICGIGDFSRECFDVVFNMDMPVNEGEAIQNIRNSEGMVSRKTLLENHPWVKDTEEEWERLNLEQREKGSSFPEKRG